jgi:hypothetical protein
LQDGAWRYAVAGADRYQALPGSVDGWVWGRGAEGQAPSPPPLTLAEICAAGPTTPAAAAVASAGKPPVLAYLAFGALCLALWLWLQRARRT